MSNANSKSIIIIGGGIGGLYAAWKLSETGYHVILLERENFLGGLSSSITLDECVMDIGPHFVSLEKNSDITKDIFNLIDKKNIITLPSITQSYKSYFRGNILNFPPKLFDCFTIGTIPRLKSLFSIFLSRFYSNKTKNLMDVKSYLVSFYGKYLYETWCKPLLFHATGGTIPSLNLVKNSFAPLTIKKILNFYLINRPNRSQNNNFKNTNNILNCYFKYGMGSIIDILHKKILENDGKVILEGEIQSIDHTQKKSVVYKKNNQIFIETSDIILYSIPLSITLKWFKDSPIELEKQFHNIKTSHSIMIFLLIDIPKLFDGWILDIYDLNVLFFRITQQTYLSQSVAPSDHTLLCVEIRTHEKDPCWSYDDQTLINRIILELKKLNLLHDEIIKPLKILKFKNLYHSRFDIDHFDDEKIENYITSHGNEFSIGTAKIDTGRLVSSDVLENEKQTVSLGGFYTALLHSSDIVKKIELNSKVD